MRCSNILVALTGLSSLAAAFWDKDDYEIFRLRDELEKHEGPGVTFYDFLGIKPSATQDDVSRAYRARSRQLHPDKAKHSILSSRHLQPTAAPSDDADHPPPPPRKPSQKELRAAAKEASARFTRLGLIANILRGASRARYDHFLAHGFPRWRGTGYYYARFRPGLLSTLLGLFAFGGGALHYLVLLLGWRARRRFAERLVEDARAGAWGARGPPGPNAPGGSVESVLQAAGEEAAAPAAAAAQQGMNRRERRLQAKEGDKKERSSAKRNRSRSTGPAAAAVGGRKDVPPSAPGEPEPSGAVRRVISAGGKPLVVDAQGRVFLEEYTGGADSDEEPELFLYLVEPALMERPSFRQTVLWRAPAWAAGLVRRQVEARLPGAAKQAPAEGEAREDSGEEAGAFVVVERDEGLAGADAGAGASARQDGGKQRKRKGRK